MWSSHPDEYWYDRLLQADSVSKSLTSAQKSIIIKQSMQEAKRQKVCIEKKFGKLSGAEYLHRLGFFVEEEAEEPDAHFLYLGLLEPEERRVRIQMHHISTVEGYIRTHLPGETAQMEQLREIVILHELYHAIEECTEGIYTRNARVSRRLFGMFPWSRTVEAASEIGAIHFSKIMGGVLFSPYIYTQYLLAAANQNLEVNDECGSDCK